MASSPILSLFLAVISLSLLFQPSLSLIVNRQLGNSVHQIFIAHTTAAFGPAAGKYNVSGTLVVSSPMNACSFSSLPDFPPNHLVLIKRGECDFEVKVYNAQRKGADAVIIGDQSSGSKDRVLMGPSESVDSTKVTIPSAFVTGEDLAYMISLLSPSPSSASPTVALSTPPPSPSPSPSSPSPSPSSPSPSPPSLSPLDDEMIITATLDSRFEHPITPFNDLTPMSSSRLAGYFLILLPAIWCIFAAIYFCRKSCINSRETRTREQREVNLPVIVYSTPGESFEDEPVNRLHNDTCAICLEGFEEGVSVKVLPCNHGYHDECVTPWLRERSDKCPICKASILDAPQPPVEGERGCWSRCVRMC